MLECINNAAYHGFDAAVRVTFEQTNGRFLGVVGSPIFDKAAVLQRLMQEHGLTAKGSYAIGDSMSDVSMLEMVDNPIAFSPDKAFFSVALEHGWKIVVRRKNIVFELDATGTGYVLNSSI